MDNEQHTAQSEDLRIPEFSFGDRLRKIRTDMGVSQKEFALMVGLTSSTLAAYESGNGNPRFKNAQALALQVQDVTGVAAWWLLDYPSPLSDSNRRPPLYIVDGLGEWPDEAPKLKDVA